MQQFKIDLALIEIDAHQPDPQAITESVAHAAAAAIEPMSALVVLVVVVLQRGHVHETVDIQAGQFDEQAERRSEEHTSELQSLMRISYAVFCLNKKKTHTTYTLTDVPPPIQQTDAAPQHT